MIVERRNNEILVRFSANIKASKIQSILDYLRYEELTSESKAGQKDLDLLLKETKRTDYISSLKRLESMDNIIVDSNILFSAILNLDSTIGQLLIQG